MSTTKSHPAPLAPIDEDSWPESTEVLIMGGGPVGLSCAILLAQRGIDVFLVDRRDFVFRFPRAHLLNMRTMEAFSDMGVSDEIYAATPPHDRWRKVVWYTTATGEGQFDGMKIGEVNAWGGGSDEERYLAAGPLRHGNMPQIRLDPLLHRHAAVAAPGRIRRLQEVVAIDQDADSITATIMDVTTGEERRMSAKYLIAADGGRTSADLLGVELEGARDIREVVNYHVSMDLSSWPEEDALLAHFMHPAGGARRRGTLQAIGPTNYDRNSEEWLVSVAAWMVEGEPDSEDALFDSIRRMLGVSEDHEITMHTTTRWNYHGLIADKFRVGRGFLAGDAAHKHPPTGGLGLNGGVQDAHNLCWKMAAVLRDEAPDALLDSYDAERRPTVAWYTAHSLENANRHPPIAINLGFSEDEAAGFENLERFVSDTPEGADMRERVEAAVAHNSYDYGQLGVESGYHYWSGAFVPDGTPLPGDHLDPITFHSTSRPGHHLPHAWLTQTAGATAEAPIAVHDLIEPYGLTLLTSESASAAWVDAAAAAGAPMVVTVVAIPDAETAWADVREIGEQGALLIRPDRKVAWRSPELPVDPAAELREALAVILGGGETPESDPSEPYMVRIRAAASVLVR